jgi:hypothetical protein
VWDLTNSVANTELGKPNEVSGHGAHPGLLFPSEINREVSMAYIAITGFFLYVMSIAGLALFFGSDYAQKKWNPEGK